MSRAVPFSGRAAVTLSSTTQNAVKPATEGVHRYLTNLRLRTSTFHAEPQGSRIGSVDWPRSESLAYRRLKPKSLIQIRQASTASVARVNEEEDIHDWYDWNHNYQLPAYVDPYIPYAFSSDYDRASRHEDDRAAGTGNMGKSKLGKEVAVTERPLESVAVNCATLMDSSKDSKGISHIPETNWESIQAVLQLDPKAGAKELKACVKRDALGVIQLAESRATDKDWRKILDRSRSALHFLRSARQSVRLSESAASLRMLQVVASIHVGETTKALGLLSRLLADTSAWTTARHLLPHLPSVIRQLSEREQISDVLVALAPLFGKREALGWSCPKPLRETVARLSISIGNPITWFDQQRSKVLEVSDEAKRQSLEYEIAELAIFAAINYASSRLLCKLYDEIDHLGIHLSRSALANLVSRLTLLGSREKAHTIYSTIDLTAELDSNSADSVIRMLHDLDLGDVAAHILAQKPLNINIKLVLDTLKYCVTHQMQDVALAIVSVQHPRVVEVLSGQIAAPSLVKHEQQVLKCLFTAYTSIGDIEQAETLLRIMVDQDMFLRTAYYNHLLKAYALRHDAASTDRILDQMRRRSVRLDRITYTTLMSLYVNQKDTDSVQRTFDEMQQEGFIPDSISFAILLNAYIEAGNLAKASSIWRNLPQDMQTNPSIANTLLKGMVLLSAPFQEVYRLFLSAYTDPSKADQIAWTILIQSACDSGNLARARELYKDFTRLTHQNPSLRLDHFLSSILVVGHIRHNDIPTAKRLYHEMQRNGAINTSVTYAAIIDAALKGVWPMPASRAKDLAHRLLAESTTLRREPHKGRGQPVENILVPLIQSAIRDGDIEEVERLFKLALEKDTRPSLLLYGMLLDAYRHAGEYDRVQQVWDVIQRLAVNQRAGISRSIGAEDASGRDCRLCIPLSIYIDAMSSANRLQDILRVWADLRESGFGFDAHNWNHLAVALIRCGDVLRGFDIVENVLIKRHEEILSRQFVGIRPQNSRSESLPVALAINDSASSVEEHLLLDAIQRPPNRRHELRDDAASYRVLRHERHERLSGVDSAAQSTGLNFDPNIFERWRPTDAMWRPAYLTVAVLDRTYSDLEKGKSMLALVAAEEEEAELERTSTLEDENPGAANPRQSSPVALLAKINSKYAKTVALIMLHRRKQKDGDLVRKRAPRQNA